MRFLAFAFLTLGLVAAPHAQFDAPSLSTTASAPSSIAPDDLHLVEYGSDLTVRDRLIEAGRFLGDLGRAGIARLDPATAAALNGSGSPATSFDEPAPGEVLVAAVRNAAGIGPIHGRLLLARRTLFLSAAFPAELPEGCRGSGFHGGLQVIAVDRSFTPQPAREFGAGEDMPDPAIQALVAQVSQTNLQNHVTALSAIFSRRTTRSENAQAITYVTGQLAAIPGLTFRTETFSSSYGPNIIAELPGTDLAGEIVMVGAHIDSIVSGNSAARAPGADDNASGSAAVIEIARILATQPLRRTVRFGWWNAEELGLLGAQAYANAAAARGDRIVAYVNTDMNAYRQAGDTLSVDYITNDSSTSLTNALVAATRTYLPGVQTNVGPIFGGTSDHRAFARAGFAAAFPFEDIGSYSPFIHTTNDVVGTSANDFQLSRLITQSIVAGMAELAEIAIANPGAFRVFGQGCPGTGTIPSTCASNNPNGGTLQGLTRNNEYSYAVPSIGARQVLGFEVYSRSTTGGNVTVGAHLYADAGGQPAASPLASTTITIGGTPGFYRATLAGPVAVTGAFHVSIDHSAQTTLLCELTSGAPGSGFWRRPALSGSWSASGIIDAPSFRIECTGGTSNAVPEIANQGVAILARSFDVTLDRAAPGATVAHILGLSDMVWAGGALPLTLPGTTCSLLVSTESLDQRVADANGAATVTVPVPNDAGLIGARVFHQWAVIDPGANPIGIALSAAAESTIGG